MAKKPGIPKGTRDFSPTEVARRQYIMQTIRHGFEKFGFHPIETPSFENLDTLLGKYGEEGDRLIFKILNSGDYLSKVDETVLESKNSLKLTNQISEKALRYDLTVPFARYVVMHQNELDFPFKRYQMQPVWRADRPQKGRYREFYQCDADVIGSKSLWQEVEFVTLYDRVFTALGVHGVTIKLNNRKILAGIAEVIDASDKLIDFTVALDKLDKIGEDGVKAEMIEKGIAAESIEKVKALFNFTGTFEEKLAKLRVMLASSEEGLKGVEELAFVGREVALIGLQTAKLNLDVTLARGLNYYTGAIFEIGAPETVQLGSIGGGGRYDDLTGIFGLKDMSGVGISFGLDRIYLVMEELNLFPETVSASSKAMFLNMGEEEMSYGVQAVMKLRDAGIRTEVYPDKAKVGKQFQFADKKGIPYAVLVGSQEMADQKYTLKELASGEQEVLSLEELIAKLK
ncbi:histidyl-tRNA synthetase [Myroides odoratimimus]|uniref:Histidine--tRNA ligase n=1 Tax=Myroides odoratimimus CCUG 10230 TaxID=883150 RepID=A0ABN0EDG2_9FLAO|nr:MULTISPECIES: histidine--tRNA ligase [Myroides]AJA69297.1 histidyl-tRNA synthetase [Myroides sp. A21]EHO11986.1 histidyl-tRNA synthetase [Myroides odoratimimus CCUG 10230]MDM1455860.1 histidine--tRNA ligase [Myroides odoratimimus]MDM1499933.1 histidine--tRNA ligase [Myroides odoratimimus]MDM1507233.1 histidine--tRNA ligase [Myroides odoratimimus]